MANKFEGIVRPFQEGDVFSAKVLAPSSPTVTADDVTTEVGKPVKLIAKPIGVRDLNSGKLKETGRWTSTVRVENPDDPDQYVMVERIDRLRLQDDSGQEHDWTFNNPPA